MQPSAHVAKALPTRIESDEEFDHFVEIMEELDRAGEESELTAEEAALRSLLAILVKEYADPV